MKSKSVNKENTWMKGIKGINEWVGKERHPAPIPALMPMSSRPSMIISKEPALRLKPNRTAAATTNVLFTRRDFFLGESGTGKGRLRLVWRDYPMGTPLCNSSQPWSDPCVCVNCDKGSKLHEWKWPLAIVPGVTCGMPWGAYAYFPPRHTPNHSPFCLYHSLKWQNLGFMALSLQTKHYSA